MISDGGDIKPKQPHHLNRSLIVIRGRDKGAGTDQIAGADDDMMRVVTYPFCHISREIVGSPDVDRWLPRYSGELRGRLQVPVEVIERTTLIIAGKVDAGSGACAQLRTTRVSTTTRRRNAIIVFIRAVLIS